MRNKKRVRTHNEDGANFWQSYSDLMAAMLLMFILIMSLTILQSMKLYESQQKELHQLKSAKENIIDELSTTFKQSDFEVQVDQKTGAVTFNSEILFDFAKSDLKPEGKKFLKKFLPEYFKVILSEENVDYVSEIIIEGHADTDGEYMHNLELSQDRAYSVASFCLEENSGIVSDDQLKTLRKIVTANGRSFSDPVRNSNGKINKAKSRRVEIKFRPKNDKMIENMQDLIGN